MCNKAKYPTREEAKADARLIHVQRKRFSRKTCHSAKSGRKLHPYWCRYCGFWHLTSQRPRRKKAVDSAVSND
jgi:hypothetical protein